MEHSTRAAWLPRPSRLGIGRSEATTDAKVQSATAAAGVPEPDLNDPGLVELYERNGPLPPSLSSLLSVARSQVDFQVQMADRLEGKARGLAVITAGLVALMQAGVLGLGALNHRHHDEWAQYVLVGGFVVVIVVLVVALALIAWSTLLAAEKEILPDLLMDKIVPAQADDPRVGVELTYWYLDLAHSRKTTNDERTKRIRLAESCAFVTLVVAGLELCLAVVSKLL